MPQRGRKDGCGTLNVWRVPRIEGLELLHGLEMTHEYPPHVHRDYSVLLVLSGAELQTSRGRRYSATRGDIVLNNPDEAHASSSIRTEYRIMRIRERLLARIAGEALPAKFRRPRFVHSQLRDQTCFRMLLNLHLRLQQEGFILEHETAFISTMTLFLAHINNRYNSFDLTRAEYRHVSQIRDYLIGNYTENVSLADLTALTSLSPYYLIRVFRKQVGFTPHEYQTQLRIAHARKLIRNGAAISQAALETGFFDQSHFTRNFKRVVGMTPGAYSSQSNIVQYPAH